MHNYSNFFKILIVCISLNGCTECRKDSFYPKIKYYFLQSVNLSPNQKTYNRLDTIKIEIVVSNKILFDTLSKTGVQTDSISLPLSFPIYNLNNIQPGARDGYFDVVDSNGQRLVVDTVYSYVNHGINFSTSVNCTNNADYRFKIGIVLKDTGTYVMSLSGGSVNACMFTNNPPGYFSYIDYFFNLTDFNEDIFNSVPQYLRREGGFDAGTKRQFAFRVID